MGGFELYVKPSLIFHHIDLSVYRTQLMKESHNQLLQLCSSIDKDFLDLQIPPTKPTKRKKGKFVPPSLSPVSDGHHQVPGESTTSLGSTARNESYPAQPQLQLLPYHKINVPNRQRFDGVDMIVDCVIVWYLTYIDDTLVWVVSFLVSFSRLSY